MHRFCYQFHFELHVQWKKLAHSYGLWTVNIFFGFHFNWLLLIWFLLLIATAKLTAWAIIEKEAGPKTLLKTSSGWEKTYFVGIVGMISHEPHWTFAHYKTKRVVHILQSWSAIFHSKCTKVLLCAWVNEPKPNWWIKRPPSTFTSIECKHWLIWCVVFLCDSWRPMLHTCSMIFLVFFLCALVSTQHSTIERYACYNAIFSDKRMIGL